MSAEALSKVRPARFPEADHGTEDALPASLAAEDRGRITRRSIHHFSGRDQGPCVLREVLPGLSSQGALHPLAPGTRAHLHPATWHGIEQRARFGNAAVRLDYQRTRPNAERIWAQLKRKLSGARLGYRGLVRNRLHLELVCATWNLRVLLGLGLTRAGGSWVLAT